MVNIRFIHTADIHLGSFLNVAGGNMPSQIEEVIEEATLEGFRRVCHAAIANEVDFMVISGDLYDREARSVRALGFFAEQCRLLQEANIQVLVIAGNHDPLREKRDLFEMPDNVKVFGSSEPEIYEVMDKEDRPMARIIGQSYDGRSERKKVHLKYTVPDGDIWNIALLHTQLESDNSNYIPCSLADLKAREDIHYWALGHIHKYENLSDSRSYIAYPGIPQGRDFGEEGRGGCILVEMDAYRGCEMTFIPIAPIIYKRIPVSIEGAPDKPLETIDELADTICWIGDGLRETEGDMDYPVLGYIIEWILEGRGEIHDTLLEQEGESKEELVSLLRQNYYGDDPFLWTNSVSYRTQPNIDYERLLKGNYIIEEVDRFIQMCSKDDDIKARLMRELGEIWKGKEDAENTDDRDDFRFFMDKDSLEDVLGQVRQIIIEKLVRGRV